MSIRDLLVVALGLSLSGAVLADGAPAKLAIEGPLAKESNIQPVAKLSLENLVAPEMKLGAKPTPATTAQAPGGSREARFKQLYGESVSDDDAALAEAVNAGAGPAPKAKASETAAPKAPEASRIRGLLNKSGEKAPTK